MKVNPVNEHVVVQLDEAISRSKGGIYIPESAKEKPQRGTVVSISKNSSIVGVGQSVLFGHYVAKTEMKGEKDETLLLIKESDILAIVE